MGIALVVVAIQTLSMLVVTRTVALAIYEWVGVGFLRRGWINLDLVWTIALIGTALFASTESAPAAQASAIDFRIRASSLVARKAGSFLQTLRNQPGCFDENVVKS